MADFAMQRMRFSEDGTAEEFPPRSEPTGRWSLSPNDPDFEVREPWPLGLGIYDAYGEVLP
ncbi:MAG: hypothetical protein EOM21_19655 [Gammaproteobacteria bacterium]|nr:hypothetical protein [Gammaproteobacteria bacterium]